MSALQLVLEVDERRDVALRVLVDPPVVDQPDRHGIEEVQLLPAGSAGHHEPRVLQDAQVLHDAVARHLHLRLQLTEGAAVATEQQVEQEPPSRIGERLEHAIVVRHGQTICDPKVTCQRVRTRLSAAPPEGCGAQGARPQRNFAVRLSIVRSTVATLTWEIPLVAPAATIASCAARSVPHTASASPSSVVPRAPTSQRSPDPWITAMAASTYAWGSSGVPGGDGATWISAITMSISPPAPCRGPPRAYEWWGARALRPPCRGPPRA